MSAAGDVNGDGFDDLFVSANASGANSPGSRERFYVVFGKSGGLGPSVSLSQLTEQSGFKLVGESSYDRLGIALGVGDVNGDGFDDVIVGARFADAAPARPRVRRMFSSALTPARSRSTAARAMRR